MHKVVTLLLLLFMPLCFGGSDELIVITSADNPPYEFMQRGEIVGFDIDLAKAIADRLGKKLIIKDMPFSSIIPALISKQGDCAIAAISPTDARRENMDFSIPYQSNTSAVILVNKEEFSYMGNSNAVFPLALLEGKTVGVQLGTHHETDARAANIKNLVIRRYDNIGTMVAEIVKSINGKGILYGVIIGTPEAKEIVRKYSKLCSFPLKFEDSFAIAFPKGSHLRSEVNKIIELFIANGRLTQLEIKWDIVK